jgi:hypothetical protein
MRGEIDWQIWFTIAKIEEKNNIYNCPEKKKILKYTANKLG